MRASERFGAGNDERAVQDAASSSVFNGGVHPLSPLAGLCAASAMAGTETPSAAVPICLGVANQAASMDQFEWVGEALQLAAGCVGESEALAVTQAGQVAATNLLRKSRLSALHCLLASADAAVTAGELERAGSHSQTMADPALLFNSLMRRPDWFQNFQRAPMTKTSISS